MPTSKNLYLRLLSTKIATKIFFRFNQLLLSVWYRNNLFIQAGSEGLEVDERAQSNADFFDEFCEKLEIQKPVIVSGRGLLARQKKNFQDFSRKKKKY